MHAAALTLRRQACPLWGSNHAHLAACNWDAAWGHLGKSGRPGAEMAGLLLVLAVGLPLHYRRKRRLLLQGRR